MFTLVLCFPRQGNRPRSQNSVTAGHVPQIGSTINTTGLHSGTWTVHHVGQDADEATLSNTVYVYLEETD
ncbi:hypothetical protein SEA_FRANKENWEENIE_318 [Streptomyces phage Frankenweenie]|nr:hypothetical protein SEA_FRANKENWEENIE_318 [Streptomyces phage Frankenweenie]